MIKHSVGLGGRERANELRHRLHMAWNAKPSSDLINRQGASGGPRRLQGGVQSPAPEQAAKVM